MRNYFNLIIERLEQGKSLAGLTVIDQDANASYTAGAKMLVEKQGTGAVSIWGGIGGGNMEKQARHGALQTMQDGLPRIMDFDLGDELRDLAGLECGGKVRVLAELFSPVNLDFFLNYQEEWQQRQPVFVSINLANGERKLLDEKKAEPDKALIRSALKQRGSCLVSRKGKDYYVEYKPIVPRLILLGGGQRSFFTARLASMLGYELIVVDDRQDFCNQSRFPEALALLVKPGFQDIFADLEVDQDSCLVIMTRAPQFDYLALTQALATSAGYIGMIGDACKRDEIFAKLLEQGVEASVLKRVHCPIGLPIGARTPEEIAISIAAELTRLRRGA